MKKFFQGKRIFTHKFPENPGEYSKLKQADGTSRWIVCAPNGHYGTLVTHKIIEHDDGSITVSPSILLKISNDGGKTYKELWHGWLKKGIWQSC